MRTLAGLNGANTLLFDKNGNLYVANGLGNNVSIFFPGATSPSQTFTGALTNPLSNPTSLAFDASGNLYVTNDAGTTVNEYTTVPPSVNSILSVTSFTVNDGNSGNNYSVTTATVTTGVITAAPLTITATANTKVYDSTTSAAALPTVAGLKGSDTITGVQEGYASPIPGATSLLKIVGYTINDNNGGFNYAVTAVSKNIGVISKALLTITATTNTKTYDSTTTAAATPTVSGLVGADFVASLGEVFSDKNAGTGKPLSVSAYTILDGNHGNNYSVIKVIDSTGVITPKGLTVTGITGKNKVYDSTLSAGLNTVGGTLSGIIGGDIVTLVTSGATGTFASANVASAISVTASGLTTGGAQGLTYFIIQPTTTANITPAPLTISAIPNTKSYDQTTSALAVPTVTGLFGTDTVTGRAEVYVDPNVGTGKTLSVSAYTINDGNSGNNYTVLTVDNNTGVINPAPISNFVTGFSSGPNGFTATFSRPLDPTALTLYGTNLTTPQDVTLRGSHGPIHGSLVFDPTNMSFTFVATANYLLELNSMRGLNSAVLPDDTYTVTLLSGAGSNGFLYALEGGAGPGLGNYTTTFTTSYQRNATPVLSIPDFARGPDSNSPIQVPNVFASGIPITLYNAAAVTDVTFSLSYNPALLTVGAFGGAGSDASDQNHASLILVSNSGGVATFHYSDPNPVSATPTAPLVFGDITAVVPSNAGAAALSLYQVKELLQLGNIVINGNDASGGAVSANGVHVNAYFGDVNGDKVISGLDTLTANTVAQGQAAGFSAFSQLDPVIIGDVAGDYSVDAADVGTIDSFVAMLHPLQIPMPPTQLLPTDPNYVNPNSIHSPNAADPTLSLTRGLTALGSPVVSVMIDHPDPDGSTGLTSVTLALTYDPAAFSVSPADITLGSIPRTGRPVGRFRPSWISQRVRLASSYIA